MYFQKDNIFTATQITTKAPFLGFKQMAFQWRLSSLVALALFNVSFEYALSCNKIPRSFSFHIAQYEGFNVTYSEFASETPPPRRRVRLGCAGTVMRFMNEWTNEWEDFPSN